MKKNKVFLSILTAVLITALFVCAKIEADTQVISDICYTFIAEFPKSVVNHTPINSVSASTKLLNAKINVDFGCYESATAKMLYYLNGDSSAVREQSAGSITDKQDFFIALPQFSETDTKVDYQIEVTLKIRNEETKMYYPVKADETPYYITANIIQSSSTVINGAQGGTVSFESGDQSAGDASVTINPGAYDGDKTINIEILDPGLLGGLAPARAAIIQTGSAVALIGVDVDGDYDFTLNTPAQYGIPYADMKDGDKFIVKRGASTSAINEYVKVTSIDYENKKIYVTSSKTGYFAAWIGKEVSKNDYRPARRVIVKARAESRGDVFQFNYLTEGDSVKIYNVNGKKVRELNGGTFAWDGKDYSGRYVESGTYIYQIKVDGKVISGTIAFVK
ncbi:gliding motility-associated C-terminal domain-containing protein [Candidatus Ruminimicrobium bovinum]|uniref:T9SS type B sorting domain-containing protein n=1 Tax=Candidatus Ruminimicrobium bovinum TaxID=3242779 RepID=UPI0039B9AF75